jgi:hypothetical protein
MDVGARRLILLCVVLLLPSAGCSRQDQRLQQHRKQFESLGATTAAISEAWLAGSVSGTYALTALDQTFRLVGQEQTALAGAPRALIDARGAELSQAAEKLLRLLALLTRDIRSADASAVRQHLAEIPIKPAGSR